MFNACEKKMKLLKVIKTNSQPSTYEKKIVATDSIPLTFTNHVF